MANLAEAAARTCSNATTYIERTLSVAKNSIHDKKHFAT